jgi:hypothetical protein
MKESKFTDIDRRSVLKVVGASAVVGGVVSGTATAQEGTTRIVWTGQGAEIDPTCESANYHFVLTPGGNALGEAEMTYNGETIDGERRGDGRSATLHFDIEESSLIQYAEVEFTGGSNRSQFTLSDWDCLDENGNGNTPPIFVGGGCSQVCNVEDIGDVDVRYTDEYGDGDRECDPVDDPTDALQEGDYQGQEDCWEIVSSDYKIVGAEGFINTDEEGNPRQCAEVCFRS